ncbi:MAG: hypothetical protein IPO07_30215 [Haliscomenobacter sp.]|nr:hypothetical protein [Haliscomenobacter sp.]MBK9492580.1 hypothetical protein [Haliscomenobacter sp.]
MKVLIEDYTYTTQEEFTLLTESIQREMDQGVLLKFIDPSWKKPLQEAWKGTYIAIAERKMYEFDGTYHVSSKGEHNFKGSWKIMRTEKEGTEPSIFTSQYRFVRQEPGVFVDLTYEIEFLPREKTAITVDWSLANANGTDHSRLIQSTVEFGIVSAFEDCSPKPGKYAIKVKNLRYHPIDTSFSLIEYAANRNFKRAIFVEHEDGNPTIEKGMMSRKFRATQTISRFNNEG